MDRKRIANGYAAGANGAGGIKNGDHFVSVQHLLSCCEGEVADEKLRRALRQGSFSAAMTQGHLPPLKL